MSAAPRFGLLLIKEHPRWHGWPVRILYASVTADLTVTGGEMLLAPPPDWPVNPRVDDPGPIAGALVSPAAALGRLNDLFGPGLVYTCPFHTMLYRDRTPVLLEALEGEAGAFRTFRLPTVAEGLRPTHQLKLVEDCRLTIDARLLGWADDVAGIIAVATAHAAAIRAIAACTATLREVGLVAADASAGSGRPEPDAADAAQPTALATAGADKGNDRGTPRSTRRVTPELAVELLDRFVGIAAGNGQAAMVAYGDLPALIAVLSDITGDLVGHS